MHVGLVRHNMSGSGLSHKSKDILTENQTWHSSNMTRV